MHHTENDTNSNKKLAPNTKKGERGKETKIKTNAFNGMLSAASRREQKKEASPSPSQGGDVLTGSRGVSIYNRVDVFLY